MEMRYNTIREGVVRAEVREFCVWAIIGDSVANRRHYSAIFAVTPEIEMLKCASRWQEVFTRLVKRRDENHTPAAYIFRCNAPIYRRICH